jgi:hypothetical protein
MAREGVAMQAKNKLTKAIANAIRSIRFSVECGFKPGLTYKMQSQAERERFLEGLRSAEVKEAAYPGGLSLVATWGLKGAGRRP